MPRTPRPVCASFALVCFALLATPTDALGSRSKLRQIDKGFDVFTKETFKGNGRTCATCHIPEDAYNIFPSSIRKLSRAERKLVFSPGTVGLESAPLIKSHALFNIAGKAGFCPADDPSCYHLDGHDGPIFRSTMTIQALALTMRNTGNFPGTPLLPASCSTAVAKFQDQTGWSGDGAPGAQKFFDDPSTPGIDESIVCRSHHGFFDPDATGTLRGFANAAIAQHNTKTLNRQVGVDFRLATAKELDALEAFQLWLGRRKLTAKENLRQGTTDASEFDIRKLQFKDSRVALGRDHFAAPAGFIGAPPPNPPPLGAGCNGCHQNGGANGFAGGNHNMNTHVELGSDDIGLAVVGFPLPHDEGAADNFGPPNAPPSFEEAFNIQSIIEAAEKKAWFHNHRAQKHIENAIEFYISNDFVANAGIPPNVNIFRNGNGTTISFPKGDGVAHLGAFLRALNAFYNLRDCERLIHETIKRVSWWMSTENAVRHCEFNLDHTTRVLKESKLPHLHRDVAWEAQRVKRDLRYAARSRDIWRLEVIKAYVKDLRGRIAMQAVAKAPKPDPKPRRPRGPAPPKPRFPFHFFR